MLSSFKKSPVEQETIGCYNIFQVGSLSYYYQHKKPCYFGATYEFLTDDHTCEGAIGLRAVSEVEFEDDGHAIAWAMAH